MDILEELEKLKYYKEIVESKSYKDLRESQLNKILELSSSNIEPLELKGMLRIINYTDSVVNKYNNLYEEYKNQRSN